MKRIVIIILILSISLCEARHPVHGHHKRPSHPKLIAQRLPEELSHEKEVQEKNNVAIRQIQQPRIIEQSKPIKISFLHIDDIYKQSSAKPKQSVTLDSDDLEQHFINLENNDEEFDLELEQRNVRNSWTISLLMATAFVCAGLIKTKSIFDIQGGINALGRMLTSLYGI